MSRRPREDILFHGGSLSDYLEAQQKDMVASVARIPEEQLLATPVEDLVTATWRPYGCQPLELHQDRTTMSENETTMSIDDVRDGRLIYHDDDDDRPRRVPGHCYNFHVPFDGDPRFWKLQGSQTSYSPPYARVHATELIFSYAVVQHERPEDIKPRFEQEVRHAAELAQNSAMSINQHNAKLPTEARRAIERRREALLKARKSVAAFGYPLRPREGASAQPVPLVRKPLVTRPSPTVSSSPFKPEPAIDEPQYESILQIISNMALVFERSPSAFRTANEETIRTHFLVQLNGHFEGDATGETFNAAGKTDVLIRVDGKNVFIAECKFWTGAKGFTDAMDQLLSYTSWRDTKTALLMFNRGTQTSTVVSQVPGLLAAHPQFKRAVPQQGETRFRAIMRQPSDANRELWLTVLVFDVPGST